MLCGAGNSCHFHEEEWSGQVPELEEQYDPYGIYAGKWHPECWEHHGYGNFSFDPTYAGESLEEDW